jgi:hypothetical protein
MTKFALVFALIVSLAVPGNKAATSAKTFLDDVAGMAAYFQFNGPTNLSSNLLRNQFRVVEFATADYLLGSVACVGFEADSSQDAKVLVHNAGWVVAYFSKDRPISQIVDQPMVAETRLDKVLAKIAYAADVPSYVTSYTHNQYPQASSLARIGVLRSNVAGETNADVRLPSSQTIYAGGWHVRIQNSLVHGWFKLDQRELGATPYGYGSSKLVDGALQPAELITNARHVVTVGLSNSSWGYSYGELDVLYSGPDGASLTGTDWYRIIPLQTVPAELQSAAADVPRFLSLYLPAINN